jgi:homoserine kinase
MFARVPASSANLGPGFDALAVALALYLEVTIEPADSLEVTSEGCGAGQFDDERNLAARVATEVLGHSKFRVHVNSEIPLSRGLGSSAALAVAAAAAAGAADPLAVAARIDGHAENAGASLLGGLVVAGVDDGGNAVVRPLSLDVAWRFVVVIPDQELSTADARLALPNEVPFADATRNLSSLGLLIAGLGDHRSFVSSAMDDVLHQPYRMGLLSFARPLLDALRDGGAAASCWSGAGSAMLGLATVESAPGVLEAARGFLDERSLPGTVLLLEADRVGLVVR